MGTKKQESKKPRSFDDLGQDEQFQFGGQIFTVPAITQQVSEELAEIAAEMRKAISDEDYVLSNKLTFKYVVAGMAASHSEAELKKLPKQVISAIMTMLSTEMMGVPTGPEVTEDQAAEVKK